jgi:predicted amino acid racemase
MAILHINLPRLRANLDIAARTCERRGLAFLPVTKLIQSRPDILARIDHSALSRLADVNVPNLARLDKTSQKDRVLFRTRFQDADEIARHATRVFLSNPAVAKALGQAREAIDPGNPLEVMLVVEAGDLRDGVPWEEAPSVLRSITDEPGVRVRGLAANFGCLAGALPSPELLAILAERYRRLKKNCGLPLEEFSLGGTVCWDMVRDGLTPPEFTELRMGEACFFGWNTSRRQRIPELSNDVFRIDLEVLEIWNKNVPPPASDAIYLGFNAFGEHVKQPFIGQRRRAVLEGGENVAPWRSLESLISGVIPVGASHEYLVLDCENASAGIAAGDRISFRPAYEAVTRCFMSSFIEILPGEEP